MRACFVLVFAAIACGQQAAQEAFPCGTATVTASPMGGPTTLQCLTSTGSPQTIIWPNGSHIMLFGATGSWAPLNTQTFMIARMVVSATGTTWYLNDTGMLEVGGTYVVYPENDAGGTQTVENVLVNSIIDVNGFTMTRAQNSTTASNHYNGDYFYGPISRSPNWTTTPVDSTHFSIPLDSSSFGSFSGQTIHINRASSITDDGVNGPVPWPITSSADGSAPLLEVTSNGWQNFTIFGCPSKTNSIQCSLGYSDPFNLKGYGDYGNTSSLVVSGGTGTFSLIDWNISTTQYTRTVQANELAWLWNFSDFRVNRPWVINTVSGTCSPTTTCTITVANMGTGQGGAGVPDGTYTITGSFGGGIGFYFPIYADYYLYFLSAATTSNYPTEYPAHAVEGTFNTSFNRFSTYTCWGGAMTGIPYEWGTYPVYQPNSGGNIYNHGYHSVLFDTYAPSGSPCNWQLYETVAFPLHWVTGGGGNVPEGTNPTYTGWIGGDGPWTGVLNNYLDINWKWYLNLSSIYAIPGGQSGYQGPLNYNTVSGEPDEWFPQRAVSYNPGTGVFHLNVVTAAGVPSVCSTQATKFYFSSVSAKSAGLAASTADGTGSAALYGVNLIYQTNHDTATVGYGPKYFQMVPEMCVSGVSGNGVTPSLSFRSDPNMQVGDHVTTVGIGGNTAANQTAVAISAVTPRQFFFRSNQGYSTPVTLTNIVVTGGNTCTANLTITPNVFVGQEIAFTGAPTGIASGSPILLTWANITAVGANSFTWPCPGSTNGTYNTDYNAGALIYMAIQADPFVALTGTGNGAWNGAFTGTMTSTENLKNFAEIAFAPPNSSSPSTGGGSVVGGNLIMGGRQVHQ